MCDGKSFEHVVLDAIEKIKKFGFSVTGVARDKFSSTFSYTAGFTELKQPEVIVCGLDPMIAHQLLWTVYKSLKKGVKLKEHVQYHQIANLPIEYRLVPKELAERTATIAHQIYPKKIEVFQMVLCDTKGVMPWQPGCERKMIDTQLSPFYEEITKFVRVEKTHFKAPEAS